MLPGGAVVLDLTDGSHRTAKVLAATALAVVEQTLAPNGVQYQVALDRLGESLLGRVDAVTLLVSWARLSNGAALLERLGRSTVPLLALVPAGQMAMFSAQAAAAALAVDVLRQVGGTALVRAAPPVAVPPEPATLPSPEPVGSAPREDRPALLVAGFYGRGNCGDEALFQAIYESFCDSFDIIVAVNKFGAVDGYETWYPYNRCEVVHQCSTDIFRDRPIAAMMVGGGGLAVGFAGNLVIEARARGLPTFLSGVDLPALDMPACDPPDRAVVRGRAVVDRAVLRGYLQGFAQVMVRTRHSRDICRQLDIPAVFGADWALRLVSDDAPDITPSPRRVLIVLREFPLPLVPFSYVTAIEALVDGLRAQGWEPAFLPFCPEDARNAEELGLAGLAPTFQHWWNPRRMKQLVQMSGLVVAVGRLHPLIFAASVGVPAVSLIPPLPLPSGRRSITKVDSICADWGLAQYPTVADLLDGVASGRRVVGRRMLAAASLRLDHSVQAIRDLIIAAA